MLSTGEGSVTLWIGHLKAGDHSAARMLWDRYFHSMVRLAKKRLQSSRGCGADQDEEDVALSAFDSVCRAATRGSLEKLNDRDDLWQILMVITGRKVVDQYHKRTAAKRGGGRVLGESSMRYDDLGGLDRFAGPESDPEVAAIASEEYRRLLDSLGEDSLRQIALWKMDGLTGEEIASRLDCSLRTVANKLKLIRMSWLKGAS